MNKLKKREINQVIDKSWIYVHDRLRSEKKSIDQNRSKFHLKIVSKLNDRKIE